MYFTSTGFDNSAGGQVQALGDTHIQAGSGTINNSAGLMRSAQTLDLQAGRIDNSQTLVAGLGLEGRNVLLGAPHIDNTQGTIRADHVTGMTNLPGVFAVGDIVRGASLVVWAIKDGRDVVEHMHRWMTGNQLKEKVAA